MSGEFVKTAREISEELLETTAIAMLAGDFETLSSCFHVPHFISSAENKTVLETRDDLLQVFLQVSHDYAIKGVTKLIRICDVAEYQSATRIQAAHTQHMMAGNDRIGAATPCYSILEYIEGRWKVAASQYAVDSRTAVGHALKSWRAPQPKQS